MRRVFRPLMKSTRSFVSTCAVLATLFAAVSSAGARAEEIRNHFDADTILRPPGYFDLIVLGAPGKSRWLVLTDLNPPSAPNRLVQTETQRPDDSIAAAVRRTYTFQDGTATTMIKKGGTGKAGLLLRMADEKNYLLLLVDTATGDLALSSTVGGKTTELGKGKVSFERLWEKFGVTAAGPSLTVAFNDQKVFGATDPKPVTGRVGVAAEGSGEVSFDELILAPAEMSAK
jgi:hypothetical protein